MRPHKRHFTNGNLIRHVAVMAFTSSTGILAIYLVDLVDLLYISMLGENALAAAAGYAATVLLFASSANIGLSIAAGVLVARSLGANRTRQAQEYATSTLVIALVSGIVIPVVALPVLPEILAFLGAGAEVGDLAARYLWITLPFSVLSGCAMVMVSILRSHGDAEHAMYPALVGSVVNAGLDPLFIFTFDMGLEGAAWATVAARVATLALAVHWALTLHNAIVPPRLIWILRNFWVVSRITFPAMMTYLATPVGQAIVTREMAAFGPQAVAGMAVIARITPVAFAVVMALDGAVGPIIGQNHGAGARLRVRQTYWATVLFIALYVPVIALTLFLFRTPIAGVFGADEMMKSLLFLFCGPLALAAFFNGLIFLASASFCNLGQPSSATWLSWGQHTLGTWPFAVVMAHWLGAPGVLIGQAMGGAVFAVIGVWFSLRLIGQPLGKRARQPAWKVSPVSALYAVRMRLIRQLGLI